MTTPLTKQRREELRTAIAELTSASNERLDPKRRHEQVTRLQAAEMRVGALMLRDGTALIDAANREEVLRAEVDASRNYLQKFVVVTDAGRSLASARAATDALTAPATEGKER